LSLSGEMFTETIVELHDTLTPALDKLGLQQREPDRVVRIHAVKIS